MVTVTYDMEVASTVPAEKMYKAFVLDADNLIPKVLPQAVEKVELLEGDGGVGSIKKIHFGEGSKFKFAKHKVDAVDKDNMTYSYTIFEGDALMDVVESVSYHIKIVPTADGGSICKNRSIYTTKGDHQISEEEIKGGKERASHMFKAVEAYLHANPGAY